MFLTHLCLWWHVVIVNTIHCTENHIFFFQTSWKDGLSKKIALKFDLSCVIGKMKDDLSQTIHEIWHFRQMFWKDGLFKKDHAGAWYFLHYLERWYFLPKTWYFFPGWKTTEKWPFPRNTWKHDIFCSICSTPPCKKKKKKNQRRTYPAKIHVKVMDIPDRHPRKSSSNSLYLHERPLQAFWYIAVQQKKNQKKPRKLNI